MESSKSEYEKPFEHEEELRNKLKRQNEINVELDLENKGTVDADIAKNDDEKDEERSSVAEKTENYKVNEQIR